MSEPVPTDAELVRRTVAGDRDAFARLYDRYARLVRAIAGDAGPDRAEDVTHDVFLRAYRSITALRDADRFAPWLVGIARRVVQETRRRPVREPLSSDVADGRPPAEHSIDDADERAHVLALVSRLPEEERRAVQFFFLSGRDGTETARLLGRSRSGTYALINRAVGILARWMGADHTAGEVPR
ncbi:sigma-70 family RNA polymerase sigma factor [Gemmata sp. G18]|uniref:Sigma-70 family RNA polymerase sigma factor n=1 Tax=Gemmata palustris TaxID=2822762 RepID=A0ABS5BSU8_9BACT|nr:sigma-70 family RNA polymerase sigma factor [Gemmata palustris]MBP3956812.1 sigma-70 family RNA polymerase sigma factor [Gemmata palustris]